MDRTRSAESVYRERATPVDDMQSWGKYMEVDGRGGSEYRIVNLQYCEDGLMDVNDDVAGTAAAFGDDIAILGLASALQRDVNVVQARGGGFQEREQESFPPAPRYQIVKGLAHSDRTAPGRHRQSAFHSPGIRDCECCHGTAPA